MRSVIVVLAFLFPSLMASQTPATTQNGKVAEGEYVRLKEGKAIPGSSQSWTLWRVPGGYKLEDHFGLANPAGEFLRGLGSGNLSRDLQKSLQMEATPDALDMELDSTFRARALLVTGTKVADAKPVEVLRCEQQHQNLRCKGVNGETEIANQDAREIFYSFPFPMMFMHLVTAASPEIGGSSTVSLININSDRPTNPARGEGNIKNLGPSAIQIGNRSFSATKYQTTVRSEAGWTVEMTLWSSPKGLVAAMQTPGVPDELIALVQFKKYSDF